MTNTLQLTLSNATINAIRQGGVIANLDNNQLPQIDRETLNMFVEQSRSSKIPNSVKANFNSASKSLPRIVSIDGLGATAKSTTGRLLSEIFEVGFVSTGQFFRAITFKALETGNFKTKDDISNAPSEITEIAKTLCAEIRWVKNPDGNGKSQRFFLDGQDVSEKLHSKEISALVAAVGAMNSVQKALWPKFAEIVKDGGIMEGRNIGTDILPHASHKFWFQCSLVEKSWRRHVESSINTQTDPGPRDPIHNTSFRSTLDGLRARDNDDLNRKECKVRVPDGAIIIDTGLLELPHRTIILEAMIRAREEVWIEMLLAANSTA
jgi:CMP/dCMP kinase